MADKIIWDDEGVVWDDAPEGGVSGNRGPQSDTGSTAIPTLKQTMAAQSAADPFTAFNTGIANAATRVAAGVGKVLPQSLAKHLPTQADVDLLEAGSEGNPYARAGQVAMDVAASAPLASGKLMTQAAKMAGYGALTADQGAEATGAAYGAGGAAVGAGLSKALAAVRAGAKPTADALAFQQKMAGKQPPLVLTPGQLSDPKGWLRKTEEALADVPILGAPLRARQEDAMKGFQEWSRAMAKPPASPGSAANTISDLKQAFNQQYESLLANKVITVPQSTGNVQVSAHAAHLQETEMKNEARNLLKSPDPMNRMEGARVMDEAKTFGQFWRSQLDDGSRETLSGIDAAYSRFVPIQKASQKGVGTLVTPEDYTPKAVLKETRKTPGNAQHELAAQAEQAIGSLKPAPTIRGGLGLGGVGLGSLLLGQGPLAAGTAAGILGYGTKTGQAVARGLQRVLTGDEMLAIANALRRTGQASAAGGKKDE